MLLLIIGIGIGFFVSKADIQSITLNILDKKLISSEDYVNFLFSLEIHNKNLHK